MRMDQKNQVGICLHFDREMHAALVAEAKRSMRTLTAEMRYRLLQSLAPADSAARPPRDDPR